MNSPETHVPELTGTQSEWEGFLRAGTLAYQHCRACDTVQYYPRVLCTGCGADAEWAFSSGVGTLYSRSDVHSRSGVRSVVLVDMDEGFRAMGEFLTPDEHTPIGARLALAEDRIVLEDGTVRAAFTAADGGAGKTSAAGGSDEHAKGYAQ